MVFIGAIFGPQRIVACEIHVSKVGSNSASGTQSRPYLTIYKAASFTQSGNTVTVYAGMYRESIKSIHGGTGDSKRITFQTSQAGSVWKVELPNLFYDEYDPYVLKISGGWLNHGNWHHCGNVHLNGEAFYEKETAQEVAKAKNTWHCQADENVTTIWAHCDNSNPDIELVEINVHESLFMP